MDEKKITFRKAAKADKKLVHGWLDKPRVQEFWDISDEIAMNFDTYLQGEKGPFVYWICLYEKEPFGLIMTSDATAPDPEVKEAADHRIPWLEPEGTTLMIEFAIGEQSYLGKGYSSATLKRFAAEQPPEVKALLADPEVKNERGVHVYEEAGFVRVSTFIRGKGFFKGEPHYLMKFKLPSSS